MSQQIHKTLKKNIYVNQIIFYKNLNHYYSKHATKVEMSEVGFIKSHRMIT